MLENRRLGYAIRTIVGDGHPREAISIGRRPSRMESRRAPAKQPENDTRRIDETFVAIMNAPTAIETRRSLREHALEVA